MEMISVPTRLGVFHIISQGGSIVRLALPGRPCPECPEGDPPELLEARDQLLEYLAGRRRDFDLPLDPEGTPFQKSVWEALRAIPWGTTRTYGQIAAAIGRPKAVRAVGQANNRNPIAIFIPCHRVVGADGALTGYAGGLDMKQKLLELERGKETAS